MRGCAHCGHEGIPTARFCAACGLPLQGDEGASPLPFGHVLEGKYQVFEEIGRGGMGVVYRGHDTALDRAIAVKVLPAHFAGDAAVVERFRREARAMAALHHPNVVPVHTVGRVGALHYFVMKFIVGRSLAAALCDRLADRAPPMSVAEVAEVLIQVCAGLEHAHAHGLIHRDVKPGNIMLGDDGVATLLDFGIVKASRAGGPDTGTGLVLGTPEYIAPELARGDGPAGPATDLYALGVVAFEMLTLSALFTGETAYALVTQHLEASPPAPSSRNPAVPAALDAIVLRCLAKEPAERWASAAELSAALDAMSASERRGAARRTINRAFASIEQFLSQYATDVSAEGCFLRSREVLPVGTAVDLRFTVAGDDLLIVEGQGEVVRVASGGGRGMGLRFTQLTPAGRASLQRILARG